MRHKFFNTMPIALKKYTGFPFSLIVIVFLIFSSVSSSATSLKNSFDYCLITNGSFPANPPEAAEEHSLQASSYQNHAGDFPLRHSSSPRPLKKNNYSIAFDCKECRLLFSFISYNPLLKPGYYHFLFRHNLF